MINGFLCGCTVKLWLIVIGKSSQFPLCASSASTSTPMCRWGHMSQGLSLSSLSCSGWTMVTQRWLVFHPIWSSKHSRWWILLLGLCFLNRGTTESRHSSHSCNGGSSSSWLYLYIDEYTLRTSLRNSTSRVLSSPLCFAIIVCPTHPLFNHRRSSFSGRSCPTVEHCAAERHVASSVSVFRKRLKSHLFRHSYPNPPIVPTQWVISDSQNTVM